MMYGENKMSDRPTTDAAHLPFVSQAEGVPELQFRPLHHSKHLCQKQPNILYFSMMKEYYHGYDYR